MAINFNARRTAAASEGYNAKAGSTVGQNVASPKQIEMINTLSGMKRVVAPSVEGLTTSSASEIITKLQALPNWREATPAQVNKIISRCSDMGLEVPPLEGVGIDKVGKWIEYLEAKWKAEYAHRITGKQIEMIKKMSVCPDIDTSELYAIPAEMWEALDLAELKVKEAMHKQDEEATNLADTEVKKIKAQIEEHASKFEVEKMNKNIASDFIGKNQQVYYKWVSSRASDGQRALIQQLHTRQGNEAFTNEVLMQFSKEQADTFIDQLQKEMNSGELAGFGDLPQMTMDIPMEWGGAGFTSDQRKDTGCLWGRDAWEQTVHSLYALVGQQAEQDIVEATDQDTALKAIIEWLKAEGQGGAVMGCLSAIMTEEEYKEYMEETPDDVKGDSDIPW